MKNIIEEPSKKLVVKANKLIEARYKFTLWEMRVFTSMVSLIKPNDVEFDYCRLYIKELMRFYNSTSKEDYETIRRIPVSLSKKQVELSYIGKEGKRRWANVTLFPTVTRPADDEDDAMNAYIELKFNEELKPMLLALKDKYRIYDIRNIVPLRSVYSFRLFELLKQYENVKMKRRELGLTYLKEMLGLIETDDDYFLRIKRLRGNAKKKAVEQGKKQKYPLYADFKKRVLLKAQKDLEKHCDISFKFKEIKEGRKVKAILFQIISRRPGKVEGDKAILLEELLIDNKPPVEQKKTAVFIELYPKVKTWIGEETFRKLLADYPENQIRKAIELTLSRIEKGDKINNVAGYIISLSKQPELFDTNEKQKAKANDRKSKKREIALKKEALEAEKKKMHQDLRKAEDKLITAIFEEDPNAEAALYESLKTDRFSYFDAKKSKAENMAIPMFEAAFRGATRKKYADRFVPIDKEYLPKIKRLKIAIAKL